MSEDLLPQENPDVLPNGAVVREYTIDKMIGQGGFGITYVAHDSSFDKNVAVKEFLPTDIARRSDSGVVSARSTNFEDDFKYGLDEFVREARALDRLEHPNLVRVRAFFQESGTAYLVMEYVDGPTLADHLQKKGRLTVDELDRLLHPLLHALNYVHQNGFLHRDIKPDNIILRAGLVDDPVLIDFGAARESVGTRSRSVAALVSAGYTPLEQYSSNRSLEPASDVYSVAAVAYRCLTGDTLPAATDRAIEESIKPVAPFLEGLRPTTYVDALQSALQLRLNHRTASIVGFRDGLYPEEKNSLAVPDDSSANDDSTASTALSLAGKQAARDRSTKTMRVDFVEEIPDASPGAKSEDIASTASKTLTPLDQPSAFIVMLLAVLSVLHVVVWEFLAEKPDRSVFEQALVYFPAGAFLGTTASFSLLNRLNSRNRLPLNRVGRWLIGLLSTYLFVSIIAVLAGPLEYAVTTLTTIEDQGAGSESVMKILLDFPINLFSSFYMMADFAPGAFAVFAIGLGLLFALANRPVLRNFSERTQVGVPVMAGYLVSVMAVILFSYSVLPSEVDAGAETNSEPKEESQKETQPRPEVETAEVEASLRQEFVRIGLFRSNQDTMISRAIAILEKQAGLPVSGKTSQALLDIAKNQPDQAHFSVASDGSGDAKTIQEAIEKANAGDSLWIQPGTYAGVTILDKPLRIMSVGAPDSVKLIAPDDGPAIWFKATTTNPNIQTVLAGLRFESESITHASIVFELESPILVYDNRFDVGPLCAIDLALSSGSSAQELPDRTQSVLENNEFVGGCGIIARSDTHAALTNNTFSKQSDVVIKVAGNARLEIGPNKFSDITSGHISTSQKSTTIVRGGSYQSVNGARTTILSSGESSLSIDGAALANTGGACVTVVDRASLVLRNSNLRECRSQKNAAIEIGQGASGEISDSRFSPADGQGPKLDSRQIRGVEGARIKSTGNVLEAK